MTIRKFIKKLFVTIIMIGIVLAAVLKVGYILICKVIVMIIFAVLAIRYWVGEDIRKAEEEKRGTWLFLMPSICFSYHCMHLSLSAVASLKSTFSSCSVCSFVRYRY